jgi:threonine/homoserine/homoserine lactone efflux protein
MFNALLQGIIPGLILSVGVGPIFFMLVQTSIQRGFKIAMVMEAGIIISDTFCVLCAYFGLAAVFENPDYKKTIYLVGSIVLVVFGIITFLSHKKVQFNQDDELKKGDKTKLFIKGFIFNISNPSVIFFWMAFVGLTITRYGNSRNEVLLYFAGTILTVFIIDIVKAWSADKIKSSLTEKMLVNFNKGAGIGIIGFGIGMFVKEFLL